MVHCNICAQPVGDQAAVCAPCAGTLKAALREVVGDDHLHGLAEDLDIAISKQHAFPSEGSRSRPAEAPLPIDTHASEAATVLRSTLVTWCRVLLDDHPDAPDDTLPAMATWLESHAETIRHAPWAAECVDEICAAVHQARRATDRPPERVYIGQCPICEAAIYDRAGRATARCRTPDCDGEIEDPDTHRTMRARQAAAQAPDREVTAAEGALAARALGHSITDRWIRKLDETNGLSPVRPGERPARYRLGDIIAASRPAKKAS